MIIHNAPVIALTRKQHIFLAMALLTWHTLVVFHLFTPDSVRLVCANSETTGTAHRPEAWCTHVHIH